MQAIFTNLHILVYSIQKRNKIQGLGKIKMIPAKDHKF